MALKASILKCELNISDMDAHYYNTVNLTIAQHPSETSERVMVRLLAYALHASKQLEFTKGLCASDEPELWQKSLHGTIDLWVELGLPKEERLRKACSKSEQVLLYVYGSNNSVNPWWNKIEPLLQRFEHLNVMRIGHETTQALEKFVEPSMSMQCMINDGEMSVVIRDALISVAPAVLK